MAIQQERWKMREPFAISREVMHDVGVIVVSLTGDEGTTGRGEAAGVDYDGETPESMTAQLRDVEAAIADGISRDALRQLLPAGGARNALDCALWDIEAKQSGVAAAKTAGVAPLHAVETTFTIGIGEPQEVRRKLRDAPGYELIKLKVDATRHIDIIEAARKERPHARLIVDANQSWNAELLERLMPGLAALGVELIEQPLPRDDDAALRVVHRDIPVAADESCTDAASLDRLAGLYDAVCIKLDKCGGLTEALAMSKRARELGMDVMVGNMCGTSLAMAPGFIVAQHARWVDLDGPLLQIGDRECAMRYERGTVSPPVAALWG